MLTPQALERATEGYRQGYNDAASGRPMKGNILSAEYDPMERPFYRKDYEGGYKAAKNDQRWADHDHHKRMQQEVEARNWNRANGRERHKPGRHEINEC